MGTKVSTTRLPSPELIDTIDSSELIRVVKRRLCPERTRITESVYDVYSMEELRRFLDLVIPLIHSTEPALSLMSKEKKWYSGSTSKSLGSTFGYIVGDIRLPEEPLVERKREANVFIDKRRQLWIVDPENGRVYQPTIQTKIDLFYI